MTTEDNVKAHIYFLLDRSGSMASMAGDVIGGFNHFLHAQKEDGTDAVLTLVQFDSQDAFEIVADAVPISQAKPLTADTFQPRGGTPLFDATAKLILHASARAHALVDGGEAAEQILFVTFTDGEENQSRLVSRRDLFDLIAVKKELGWTFAFLGAGMDAYADSTAVGYAPGSVQAFAPDGAGAGEAFASLSRSTASLRGKARRRETIAPDQFFEDKAAEVDRATRGS